MNLRKYKLLIYVLLLLSPFLMVVIVNESFRPEKKFTIQLNLPGTQKVSSYNDDKKAEDRCSWNCHNKGCKHDKKKNKFKIGFISKIFDSIVSFNKMPSNKGNKGLSYQIMNLIFLVVLWPLLMYILLILNINQIIDKK